MLATGLTLYFLSKEIYVINHETVSGILVVGLIVYGVKKYGPVVAAFLDKTMDVSIVLQFYYTLLNSLFCCWYIPRNITI